MELKEVDERVSAAVRTLYLADVELIEDQSHERSIAAKLAQYIGPLFPGYQVDVEYNQHLQKVKKLRYGNNSEDKDVYPDIVIHRRRTDKFNLLVLEIKKADASSSSTQKDLEKLAAYMQKPYRYTFGAFIETLIGGPRIRLFASPVQVQALLAEQF